MIFLLVVLGISAIFYINRIQKNTFRILTENVSSLKAAEELEIALLDMKGLTSYYLLSEDSLWLKSFVDKKKLFLKWFHNAKQQAFTVEEIVILEEIQKLFNEYLFYQQKVVYLKNEEKIGLAKELLFNEMFDTFNSIYDKCEELLSINEKLIAITSYKIQEDNRTSNIIINSLAISGALIGILLSLLIARGITHRIDKLVLQLKTATGDEVLGKIDISPESEFDNLDIEIKKLIEKVNKINTDLERNQQLLIRSEKLAVLGKLAASLAHEIRNPLTAIKMLVFSIHEETKKDAYLENDFDIIIKEINRIENFIENFLKFAKPPKPNFKLTTVNEIIKSPLDLLDPQIKKMNIKVINHIAESDIELMADKSLLHQVFVNIILNAIQSMEKGGTIEIGAQKLPGNEKDSEIIEIYCRDSGKGIDQEIINNIFDPFVTKKEDGTGLGLSIAYQIITDHKGWIEAKNNPERGATILVFLPKEQANESTNNSHR